MSLDAQDCANTVRRNRERHQERAAADYAMFLEVKRGLREPHEWTFDADQNSVRRPISPAVVVMLRVARRGGAPCVNLRYAAAGDPNALFGEWWLSSAYRAVALEAEVSQALTTVAAA